MILKLKLIGRNRWLFLDKIEQLDKQLIDENYKKCGSSTNNVFHIENVSGAQDGEGIIALDCVNIDYRIGEHDFHGYTELPAFLLNDKGETIERLN